MTTQTTTASDSSTVVDVSTLCEAFQRTVAAAPDAPALRAHGDTTALSRRELAAAVEEVAAGLASLGLRRGDTIGLIMTNRPEFHIVDLAALHLGATPFSIYNTSSPQQISYLLDHADCRVVVAERQFLERIRAAEASTLDHVVVVDGDDDEDLTLAEIRTQRPAEFDFEATWRQTLPGDVATLIYTSGTTGPPKGVELTHKNLMFVLQTCNERFPFASDGSCVSYLPTAHVADRIFSHYLYMVTGWTITTVRDAAALFAAVGEVRPTWLLGVPRVWEKLRSALLARFGAMPEPQRSAVEEGLARALQKVRSKQAGESVPPELEAAAAAFDEAVLAPLRTQLGLDQVSLLMTGAAPIPVAVHEFFLALGLPLSEGYGMSETGALGMTNLPDEIRLGSVGKAMPGTEARIADDGELLLRGPHVMRGYRKDPEKTAEAIDADGWLHTGDIATAEDGWYRIVDRKKELIINAGGKNMSPANIEGALKSSSPLIGQAFCYGDGRPYNVALLVLDPDAAAAYAAEHGLPDSSLAAVSADPGVLALIAAAVESANSQLSRIEQIKHYALLTQEWLPDSDELTPTSKLKRRTINIKYAEAIQSLYEDSARA